MIMLNNYYIQKNLKGLGYYKGKIDKNIGPQSKDAILHFQQDFNLRCDSIYGKETDNCLQQVVKECQVILGTKPDGMWGNDTESKYQKLNNIKYIKRSELACHCGCGANRMDIRLVKILDDIRAYYNKPIILTSPVRCISNNKKCGGKSNSWHIGGTDTNGGWHNKACDFYVVDVKVTELLNHCIDLRNQGKIRYTYTNDTNMKGVVHIDIGGIR